MNYEYYLLTVIKVHLLQKLYDDWVKKLNVWVKITCLPKESQVGAILMTLEGEAADAALELTEDEITGADGVKKYHK